MASALRGKSESKLSVSNTLPQIRGEAGVREGSGSSRSGFEFDYSPQSEHIIGVTHEVSAHLLFHRYSSRDHLSSCRFSLGRDRSQHNSADNRPGSECQTADQKFTLLAPTTIYDVKVTISGPVNSGPNPNVSFNLGLGSQLGTVTNNMGSGSLSIVPNQMFLTTQTFDFDNLNIALAAGTYYLQVAGADVLVDQAPQVTTSQGSLQNGYFFCDPTAQSCGAPASWSFAALQEPLAVDISGTVVTPEPSTFALLGLGILAILAVRQDRIAHT